MAQSSEKKTVAPRATELDDVRESAEAGQETASKALRKFRETVEEAIPESVQAEQEVAHVLKGFRNFLMRGDVITVAVGLVVALAFSNLVKAFTDSVINPLVAAAQPGHITFGLGW